MMLEKTSTAINDVLDRHHAVIEIMFAAAIYSALMYSISQRDLVSVGTLTGGIFGYMKGKADGRAEGEQHAIRVSGRGSAAVE